MPSDESKGSQLDAIGSLAQRQLDNTDALLRDSMLGELRFRASKDGREFTEAAPHNATAVYRLCPTALVFGMWDSTGPKGGQGAKFQRALVSEIVGVGVEFGRKTALVHKYR